MKGSGNVDRQEVKNIQRKMKDIRRKIKEQSGHDRNACLPHPVYMLSPSVMDVSLSHSFFAAK